MIFMSPALIFYRIPRSFGVLRRTCTFGTFMNFYRSERLVRETRTKAANG